MRPVFSRRFGGSLPRLSFAAQSLYDPLSIVARVPPSRCVRCGASSRDALCGACTDYLVAYCPFWLDPALLPGPSLIDLVDPRDVALVAADLSQVEWHAPPSETPSADAVRLVQLLRLDMDTHPVVSVGDAEILHAFRRDGRRAPPRSSEERAALVAVCRYLSACGWMPSHLASEYRLRTDVLEHAETSVEAEGTGPLDREPPIESVEPATFEAAAEPSRLPESDEEVVPPLESGPGPAPPDIEPPDSEEVALPAPQPLPPEPIPRPEPPLPLPEPPGPGPEPEPEPEPEEPADDEALAEIEAMKGALAKERADVDSWVRSRSEEIRAKEDFLAGREIAVTSKEQQVEAEARAATERLVALEKGAARREALRFLGTVPGMSESSADVIATAFPDMDALRGADAKALTQCKGVSDGLARAIRYELVPGEVEGEQRTSRLRDEAHGFLEEGDYAAALACYDRLSRAHPEDIGVWFDRAQLLVLLNRTGEALQCYARVIELDRKNGRAWFERANLLFGGGRLPEAVDALREALKIDPSKGGEIALRAEQLRRDGHPNEAVLLFQAVLDADPGEARAALGLGDSLLDLGDTDAAEALFTRALGKDPRNALLVFRKGELLERKGRWGAAIQYYNRAIALRWNFAAPWLAKGRILLDHGRAKEALEYFDKALSFEPGLVDAWAGKARALAALGDRDAAAALERASEIGPDAPAVRAAREAIGVPSPPEAESSAAAMADLPSLAKAFADIEDEPEAEPPRESVSPDFAAFVESIEPEKEDTQVLLQLAELALEGGDPQMALLRYDQAIERDARSPDAWTGKGVAFQQLERYRDALEAYDRALALKPDHEPALKWRTTCLRHVDREADG